ncbi:MAG: baeRF12 domain-containing protein [Planctomycetota bacterium]|jgi:protein required for attachment to host cells
MTARHSAWLLVTDAGACRLLRCKLTERGTPHVTEHESFRYDDIDHQHGRPSSRVGVMGHTYASEGHELDEELRRAAHYTVTWTEERVAQHGIKRLFVFAPARFLGALRAQWPDTLADRVSEFEADLTHLGAGKLQEHPLVRGLVTSETTPTM